MRTIPGRPYSVEGNWRPAAVANVLIKKSAH